MLILSYIAFIKIEILLDKYKIMHRLMHYKTFEKNYIIHTFSGMVCFCWIIAKSIKRL